MNVLGRDKEQKDKSDDKKGYRDLIIFVSLCVLVMVLGCVVVVSHMTNKTVPEEEEFYYDDTDNKEIVQMLDDISEEYREGKHDEALANYQEQMNEAAKEKDYDLYLRIFSSRDMMLMSHNSCGEIMRLYSDLNVDDLPANVKTNIYGTAAATSGECGNAERQVFYENELDRILKEEGFR